MDSSKLAILVGDGCIVISVVEGKSGVFLAIAKKGKTFPLSQGIELYLNACTLFFINNTFTRCYFTHV